MIESDWKHMKREINSILGFVLGAMIALTIVTPAGAHPPMVPAATNPAADTAMIFQPSHPLVVSVQELARQAPSSWGFNISFSDYGFGGGFFMGHNFDQDFAGLASLDFGTAAGAREVDLLTVNKINRIFVIP